jgi:prepilin-type N-terminal cleavage/methylation domain-containing protein
MRCTMGNARNSKRKNSKERGFTLIELLTVIGILGVLYYLTLTSLTVVKANAGHKTAMRLAQDARTSVEGALSEPDTIYPFAEFTQTTQGSITDAAGSQIIPEVQVSRQTSFTFYYDPDCADASCTATRVQARHCLGKSYVVWTRFGDGEEILLDSVPGAGC